MYIRSYSDWATIFHVFGREEYALKNDYWLNKIQNEYKRILETGGIPLIIDCGSNIGAASNFFALKFPKARIFGYEIAYSNHQTALTNSLPEITQVHRGIASKSGIAYVEDNGLGFNGMRLGVGSKQSIEKVETVSMSDILDKFVNQDLVPPICKIDIEGGEAELFSEDTTSFELFPFIVIEPHDWLIPEKKNLPKLHEVPHVSFQRAADPRRKFLVACLTKNDSISSRFHTPSFTLNLSPISGVIKISGQSKINARAKT